jgi:hypothetical protein
MYRGTFFLYCSASIDARAHGRGRAGRRRYVKHASVSSLANTWAAVGWRTGRGGSRDRRGRRP